MKPFFSWTLYSTISLTLCYLNKSIPYFSSFLPFSFPLHGVFIDLKLTWLSASHYGPIWYPFKLFVQGFLGHFFLGGLVHTSLWRAFSNYTLVLKDSLTFGIVLKYNRPRHFGKPILTFPLTWVLAYFICKGWSILLNYLAIAYITKWACHPTCLLSPFGVIFCCCILEIEFSQRGIVLTNILSPG